MTLDIVVLCRRAQVTKTVPKFLKGAGEGESGVVQ